MRLGIIRRLLRRQNPAPTVPASLAEAIGPDPNWWTIERQLAIRERLVLAAEREWATTALAAFDRDPNGFLRRHNDAQLVQALSEIEQLDTEIALWHAVFDLTRSTRTSWKSSARRRSLVKALSRAGISESAWLAQAGFLTFDEIHTAPNAAESAVPDAPLKERNS
jgi:hypothetical protein